nr:diguanylate cyclase [Brucella intermedia]
MRVPSSYVWKRTAMVAVIAATISISLSTGIRILIGAQPDLITIVVRLSLPFLIAIPMGLFIFSKLEKLEQSYRLAVKRANELARVASTDPLTGLLNRRSFIQQFNSANKAGVRGWFLIADIDYLKQINDQYGHPTGDLAVISAAEALEDCLSNDSLIARIGGDEFCAFVPKAGTSNIDSVVSEIGPRASGLFREKSPDIKHRLSISVGNIVCKPGHTFDEVMPLADKVLYRKKVQDR